MNFTLAQLRAFDAVCRSGSFTLAADTLHRTQPAITVQIRQLERELGLKLFDRTTRTLRMTPAAQELSGSMSHLLQELDLAVQRSQDLREKRFGTIRIGCLPSIAASWLPTRIARFRRAHPGISFVLRDELGERLLGRLHAGEVEFAITDFTPDAEDLVSQPLLEEQMRAFFPKGHALGKIRHSIGIDELARHALILMAPGSNARRIVDAAFAAASRRVEPACEAAYMATAIGMVQAGLGVAVLPALGVDQEAHPTIDSRRLEGNIFTRRIALIRLRSRTLSPGADAFVRALLRPRRPGKT